MQLLIHVYCILFMLALIYTLDLATALQSRTVKLLAALWLYIDCIDILTVSGYIAADSLLYFSDGLAFAVFAPLSFLYLRNKVKEKYFQSKDNIHLLPFVVSLASYVTLIAMNDVYVQAFRLFYNAFGYTIFTVYTVLLVQLLRYSEAIQTISNNRLAEPASENKWKAAVNTMTNPAKVIANKIKDEVASSKQVPVQFTDDQIAQMKSLIETEMAVNQPYLNHGCSIASMAEYTGINLHQLSAFINQYYKMHYNDFINMYRIEYCKKKILEDESWKLLTLQAIAEESGFGNRNTFTTAFKKTNGITPADYLKQSKLNKTYAA